MKRVAARRHFSALPRRRRLLRFEPLEMRRVLASLLVNTAEDVSDPNDAQVSLREAIAVANASPGADVISFDADAFAGRQSIELTAGQLQITDPLTINGPGSPRLMIDALGNSRVLEYAAVSGNLTLRGVTVTGGATVASDFNSNQSGAGIRFVSAGELTLDDVKVLGNATAGNRARGGGVFVDPGSLVLRNSWVLGNVTAGEQAGGGGIYVGRGSLTLTESIVSGNRTEQSSSPGGGIHAADSLVSLSNSTVSDNRTEGDRSDGGGVFAFAGIDAVNSQITGNRTFGFDSDGGGIFASANLSLLNSDVSFNTTLGDNAAGGGAAVDTATVSVQQSSITHNRTGGASAIGAGMLAVRGDVEIINSTFSKNEATGSGSDGGGIAAIFCSLNVISSTVVQNQSNGQGGGIAFIDTGNRTLQVVNSIVATNQDDSTAPDILAPVDPALLTVESTLIGDNRGTGLPESQTPSPQGNLVGDIAGGGLLDPKLQPLVRLGRTRVHPPAEDSPARDAGNNALASSLSVDQRGAPFGRLAGPHVEMGAFEIQTVSPGSLVVNSTLDAVDFSDAQVTLREAIAIANGQPGDDVIRFAPEVLGSVIELQLGSLAVTETLQIEAALPAGMTVDAGYRSRVLDVSGDGVDLSVAGLRLQKGLTHRNDEGGAGIAFDSTGTLSLANVSLSDHLTTGDGASGAGVDVRLGTLEIDTSQITGNTTLGVGAHGGGIHAGGGLVMSMTTVADNRTMGETAHGGGMYVSNADAIAAEVTRTTFSGNATLGTDSNGGAIEVDAGAIVLINTTLSSNRAALRGGGVHVNEPDGSDHRFHFTTVAGNQAEEGGGLHLASDTAGSLEIINTIVATNTDSSGHPDLDLSRVASNMRLVGSLVGDRAGNDLQEALLPDMQGNLIGASDGSGVIDPRLGQLAIQGGVTATHALLDASPAIDRGRDDVTTLPASDQRGAPFVRRFGTAVDIGAYERQTLPDATLVVTTASDELDTTNEQQSLREALALARGSDGPAIITFDPTVFAEPETIALVHGELAIEGDVQIIGSGQQKLVIDAGGRSRAISIRGADSNVVLRDLTVRGGTTTEDQPSDDEPQAARFDGGGIRVENARLTLDHVSVTENRTLGERADGGGISVHRGALVVRDSRISGNLTSGKSARGGGLASFASTLTIDRSEIQDNVTEATESVGGGIMLENGSAVISDSQVAANQTRGDSAPGGGVSIVDASVHFVRTVLENNRTIGLDSDGGGLIISGGDLTMQDTHFDSNIVSGSSSSGGGIAASQAVLQVVRSAFTGNQTQADFGDGGAVSITGSSVDVTNSTFSGNVASGQESNGGALAARNVLARLVHVTVIENAASRDGGGVVFDSSSRLQLDNSIVASNTGLAGSPDMLLTALEPSRLVVRGSLIGENEGTPLPESQVPDAEGNLVGASNGQGVIDPQLMAASNNGGFTPSHLPAQGSPAIDGASNSLAVDANGQSLAFDQRGAPFVRLFAAADRGAVEVQPPVEPVVVWEDPANIFVGTPLSELQLNATSPTAGTFEYDPDAGTVLDEGDDQALTVTFTPDDTTFFQTTTATVTIDVVPREDLGDAPDSYGTTRAQDGARHRISALRLGEIVDAEVDGKASADASGDENSDDGVQFLTPLVSSTATSTVASVVVNVSASSRLDAWIDFDRDGMFDPVNEHLFDGTSRRVSRGENVVSFAIPVAAGIGETFARFRVSSLGALLPTGGADDGEVEDYRIELSDAESPVDVAMPVFGTLTSLQRDGDALEIIQQDQTIFRAPETAIQRLQLTHESNSHVLVLDYSGGDPIPAGGFAYDGGDPVNTVRVIGAGLTLDLSDDRLQLANVDAIDLTAGQQLSIVLDVEAARAMDPTGGGVIVVGQGDDQVRFADGPSWRMSEPVTVAGFTFSKVTTLGTFIQTDFSPPWQNLAQPSDVNDDGNVSAADALRIINELARREFSDAAIGQLVSPASVSSWPDTYFDQNGDGRATALDALRVINELARLSNQQIDQALASSERWYSR